MTAPLPRQHVPCPPTVQGFLWEYVLRKRAARTIGRDTQGRTLVMARVEGKGAEEGGCAGHLACSLTPKQQDDGVGGTVIWNFYSVPLITRIVGLRAAGLITLGKAGYIVEQWTEIPDRRRALRGPAEPRCIPAGSDPIPVGSDRDPQVPLAHLISTHRGRPASTAASSFNRGYKPSGGQ
ncbi:hypothetical protein BDK51DRAFT_49800 [Blyttiomyces helicus]|uniref:Uncharacterized protein n=1 Tax=Blyttiomyces helicus TaxID=388810 RepID=A0A4P9WJ88_9FUNG|nr:hypothetical protein BDK51DRAFT_49800 [Blyttiomyces helicus]|eukprot:RKO92115.1 hypothetical protein BDK51DRAFT_49800 [Blyttiomyces helicus]